VRKRLTQEEIIAKIGQEIGKSEWLRIDQDRIDAFAACTEDCQWIHVDQKKAAAGPHGKTVAHGLLLLSLIPHLSRNVSLVPQGAVMTVNYGINRVRFIQPVPVGCEIRDTLLLNALSDKGDDKILLSIQHTIHIREQAEPACVAEMLRMYLIAPPQR